MLYDTSRTAPGGHGLASNPVQKSNQNLRIATILKNSVGILMESWYTDLTGVKPVLTVVRIEGDSLPALIRIDTRLAKCRAGS